MAPSVAKQSWAGNYCLYSNVFPFCLGVILWKCETQTQCSTGDSLGIKAVTFSEGDLDSSPQLVSDSCALKILSSRSIVILRNSS